MNETLNCMETRRSVRGYKPDAIPADELIEEVAKAGVICVLGGATTRAAAQAHGWSGQEIMA